MCGSGFSKPTHGNGGLHESVRTVRTDDDSKNAVATHVGPIPIGVLLKQKVVHTEKQKIAVFSIHELAGLDVEHSTIHHERFSG
jgi:hypothetical protein